MNQISKNIKECRLEAKLTQDQVAEKLHMTRQNISSYETGRTEPDVETIQKIADIFDVPVERLLYGDAILKKRKKLNRSIVISTGIYLLGLAVASLLLFVINTYLVHPYMKPGRSLSMSSLPEEYKRIIEMRFKALDIQYALSQLVSVFAKIGGLVIVYFDIITKPAVHVAAKGKFLGVMVLGLILAVVPFGLMDGFYGLNANYLMAPITDLIVLAIYIFLDLLVVTLRKRSHPLS